MRLVTRSVEKTLKLAYAKANKSLLRMQERYKKDFDKSVRSPNRNLRACDPVFVDFGESSTEDKLLGRPRNTLDFKIFGPYPVIANYGHSLDVDLDGLPERISADRVRAAPKSTTVEKEESPSGHGPYSPLQDDRRRGHSEKNGHNLPDR